VVRFSRPLPEAGLKHRCFLPRTKAISFDLAGYVAHRLTGAGVGAIEPLGVCTYPPENGFFSFRRTTHAREPDYGRQISAIVLTG
jgi:copper oxidase (laccase) domain-containing protein